MAHCGNIRGRQAALDVTGTRIFRRFKGTRQIMAEEGEDRRPTGHEDADVCFGHAPQDRQDDVP